MIKAMQSSFLYKYTSVRSKVKIFRLAPMLANSLTYYWPADMSKIEEIVNLITAANKNKVVVILFRKY